MRWRRSYRGDSFALQLADRHYNRTTVGAPNCGPPGRTIVLTSGTPWAGALWISNLQLHSWHAYPGAWVCSAFRNEGAGLSSELILEAVAATAFEWGSPPSAGMITFVNPRKVKAKRDPGYCFLAAGFECVATTPKKLTVLRLAPERMPDPIAPGATQIGLL
jgi:hypothetical protein